MHTPITAASGPATPARYPHVPFTQHTGSSYGCTETCWNTMVQEANSTELESLPSEKDLRTLLLPQPVDMPLPVDTTCLLHQAHGQLKRGGAEGIEFKAILDRKQFSARELPQRIYRAQSCCRCQWMRRSLWTPCAATCPLHRAHWQLIWLYRLLKECADPRRGAHRASVFALRDRFPHNPVAAASGRADPMGSHMSSAPSRWAK